MNRRSIWYSLLVAGTLILVLGLGVVAGVAITYFGFLSRPSIAKAAQPSEINRNSGILVAGVINNSPADQAGVVRGDILQKVNDENVNTFIELNQLLAGLSDGSDLDLTVVHGDEILTLSTTVDENFSRSELGIEPCGFGTSEKGFFPLQSSKLMRGATIIKVIPDSPAEDAGIDEGDIIISVDGKVVGLEENLSELISTYQPGDRVTIEIKKSRQDLEEIEIELGEHPEEANKAYLGIEYIPVEISMGGETQPFNHNQRHFRFMPFDKLAPFELPEGVEKGVIIRDVQSDSPAEEAGLREGDIITAIDGQALEKPNDLITTIKDLDPGDKITLTIFRLKDREEMTLKVELGENPSKSGAAYLGVNVVGLFDISIHKKGQIPFRNSKMFPFFFGIPEGKQPFEFNFDLPFEFPFDLPFDELFDETSSGENA